MTTQNRWSTTLTTNILKRVPKQDPAKAALSPARPVGFWAAVAAQPDKHGSVMVRPKGQYLGCSFVHREPEFDGDNRSLLDLGNTGSGKSVFATVDLVLHRGPAVSVLSKPMQADETSLMRGRLGSVWMLNPGGHVPGAYRRAVVTPLNGAPSAPELEKRFETLQWLLDHRPGRTGGHDPTWAETGVSGLLVPLCVDALRRGASWGSVVRAALRHDTTELLEVAERLSFGDAECRLQADKLYGYLAYHPRQQGGYQAAVGRIIGALSAPEMLSCEQADEMAIDAFLAGQKERANNFAWQSAVDGKIQALYGTFDTLYVVADTMVGHFPTAAIWAALTIRRKRFELAAQMKLPTLLTLNDEFVNAPDPNPGDVTQVRGYGVRLLSLMQDIGHASTVYPEAIAKGLLNTYPYKIINPGLSDVTTLDQVSRLVGEFDRPKISRRQGDGHSPEWVDSIDHDRIPLLTPADIARGVPDYPDASLMIYPDSSWEWRDLTPYWRGRWLPMFVDSIFHALKSGIAGPVPTLDQSGTFALERHGALDQWNEVRRMEGNRG